MSFKFVTDTDTALTALDAELVTEITTTGIFVGQEVRKTFKIGNLNATETDFAITTSGVNSSVNDDVDFSVDGGVTFQTTVTTSGIQPNEVSDPIIVRYTSQEGDVIGVGSFLIRVDEE